MIKYTARTHELLNTSNFKSSMPPSRHQCSIHCLPCWQFVIITQNLDKEMEMQDLSKTSTFGAILTNFLCPAQQPNEQNCELSSKENHRTWRRARVQECRLTEKSFWTGEWCPRMTASPLAAAVAGFASLPERSLAPP
jgi:hypothetical protein